nr:MAG TPA: hypothetical protein [Caudoviricetes sp.]
MNQLKPILCVNVSVNVSENIMELIVFITHI